MTEPRKVIARVLSDATDHPDVEALHRRVRDLDPSISIATVYRTMKLFEDTNIVSKRDLWVMDVLGMKRSKVTKHLIIII